MVERTDQELNDQALDLVEAAEKDGRQEEALRSFESRSREHKAAADRARSYLRLLRELPARPFSERERYRIRQQARWSRVLQPERLLRAGAVAAMVLVSAAVTLLLQPRDAPAPLVAEPPVALIDSYQSHRDRRTIELVDGSLVTLDWNSSINFQHSEDHRSVVLDHGRASFRVFPDPNRPFEVVTGAVTTRVLGTEFVVDARTDGRLKVAVIEGLVTVSTPDSGDIELTALESITAIGGRLGPKQLRLSQEGHAWREGLIILRDEKLTDAIAILGPYTSFEIDSRELTRTAARVSGTYFVDRADDALSGLIQTHRLRVDQNGYLLILRPPLPTRPGS